MHDNCILKHELPRYAKNYLKHLSHKYKNNKLGDGLGYNKQMQKYFGNLIHIAINIKNNIVENMQPCYTLSVLFSSTCAYTNTPYRYRKLFLYKYITPLISMRG